MESLLRLERRALDLRQVMERFASLLLDCRASGASRRKRHPDRPEQSAAGALSKAARH
jgi:hypothetical protein